MGIFGKKNAKKLPIDSIIGSGMLFEGNIFFAGGLHIEGEVRGNINCEKNDEALLVVAETGKIIGEIDVRTVVVSGTIIGSVRAEDLLELQSTSNVTGDMYYSSLEMQPGALVQGRLSHVDKHEGESSNWSEPKQSLKLATDSRN